MSKVLKAEHKQYGYCVDRGDGSAGIKLCTGEELEDILNDDCPYETHDMHMESDFCIKIKVYDDYSIEVIK